MDLLYMTDVIAYQSVRSPIYDKYSWDQQNRNVHEKNQHSNQKKFKVKEPCKICQDRKRRSLSKYIRSKSNEHSHHELKEEEEEDNKQNQDRN